jgi:hypothetical protein
MRQYGYNIYFIDMVNFVWQDVLMNRWLKRDVQVLWNYWISLVDRPIYIDLRYSSNSWRFEVVIYLKKNFFLVWAQNLGKDDPSSVMKIWILNL